ncbi:polynucleotide kinase-phosphatase [Chitinophaga sancti]|uniref:Polynucleotide kinase-phosphatase n=1 Tax=Chitinophaga sancti TaxID=1004 RepID=A0A1K1RYX0_9BACT|nr:polynucleotide kinase-phosphatase [Chitinophaga sancti]WQD64099.1 polynucleotide kinase-phosphatase [Chitinophaga sancti]WQG90277.1 polynucleotide kinase-phosphatase [Chitinophaga sancti]SFW77021.1 polynucleotide kinase-phosphatase [Chitinophaga sancti]
MTLNFPELSLVVLVGASGSGKSTFAKKWFRPSEIVSSDAIRLMLSNDENTQGISEDAFELLHLIIAKRLKRGLLTVVDATNVNSQYRKQLIALAREYHVLPVAVILNMSDRVCQDRNKARTDRDLAPRIIKSQMAALKSGIHKIREEGFRRHFEFRTPELIDSVTEIVREKLYNDLKHEEGPFDIIGDIHGCYDELCTLLTNLGHTVDKEAHRITATNGRKIVFLGDLVDRGPASPAVLKLVMQATSEKLALCVPGNHDIKLLKYLNGKNVQLQHGLERTVAQLEGADPVWIESLKVFLDGLVSHYVLAQGNLVVAHAGLREDMQGRGSGAVREFCLYGETTGETDEFGLPVRYNWAANYNGKAAVVYGHTPVVRPEWFNNTMDIDTGCVFGGSLTALRYPEKELVSVPALQEYATPGRPMRETMNELSLQQEHDNILDINDVIGKQLIETRLMKKISIREGNAASALEVMSRWAINPKWLIYLPPTMSPTATSSLPDYLEHPAEAFKYFKNEGVNKVVCEEKHMGSRAVVIVCKDSEVVRKRFGIREDSIGIIYTRTGRVFFDDETIEQAFLQKIADIITERGGWEVYNTDWFCLDCELMPWNLKAQALLRNQYGATGAAGRYAMQGAVASLEQAATNPAALPLLREYRERKVMIDQFARAYRQYCWDVNGLEDYQLAPFHMLATEGKTYFDQDHEWHMEALATFAGGEGNPVIATKYKVVDLDDEAAVLDATAWWLSMTEKGGEGMVVKPYHFITMNEKFFVQPAVKVRGREYLRIIYGPEYTLERNLTRLKERGLSTKRIMAQKEFALGVEALERFVGNSPLTKVHQCVFGVLAMESEAVDPRL